VDKLTSTTKKLFQIVTLNVIVVCSLKLNVIVVCSLTSPATHRAGKSRILTVADYLPCLIVFTLSPVQTKAVIGALLSKMAGSAFYLTAETIVGLHYMFGYHNLYCNVF